MAPAGWGRRSRRRRCAPRGGWRSRTRSTPDALPDRTRVSSAAWPLEPRVARLPAEVASRLPE
eukprot:1438552-Prymnesium_polylepis.1